jgi:FtsP/CotA-like multicopper oxidase with cupredoxin domain
MLSAGGMPGAARAATREYWIAAVPTTWNIVPNGRDAISGERFDPAATTIGTVVYRRFTARWKQPVRNNPAISADNDRIPGPLIRARVGDRIVVHFRNADTLFNRPHSMHFHGVHYRPGSDGSFIPGFSGLDGNVPPGRTYTYRLTAGPDSVGVWPYHDHSPSMMDSIAGGMFGAMSILGPGEPRSDREFVVYFTQMLDFMTIDGHAFLGNTPVFHARVGELVQWDVLTLGDDHHTFHVHGHRWLAADRTPLDTRTLGPAESFRVRWREDAPGTWLYHCHVEDHMDRGMIGLYRVSRR